MNLALDTGPASASLRGAEPVISGRHFTPAPALTTPQPVIGPRNIISLWLWFQFREEVGVQQCSLRLKKNVFRASASTQSNNGSKSAPEPILGRGSEALS